MSTYPATDVLIIGGGVSGCAIAYQLRKADVDVTLVERAEIAAEASSAAAGLLAPGGVLNGPKAGADLYLASWDITEATLQEITEASGIATEYQQTGALHLPEDEHERAQLDEYRHIWQDRGWAAKWLTSDEVREYEPLLADISSPALYVEHASSIRPRQVTRAYAEAARKLGAHIYEQTEVTGFLKNAGKVDAVRLAGGETIACQRVVVASGAWSAQIGEWLDLYIPVVPSRGQILALKQMLQPLKHTIFGNDLYIVPKVDNTIYVGATRERVGFDKNITVGGLLWLLSRAIKLIPAFEQADIARIWTGLRPLSEDGYPILGHVPNWENVVLATGHGAGGFELSAITGRTIADLLLTGKVAQVIQPFGIERFGQEK
jgi:glycine oxidase